MFFSCFGVAACAAFTIGCFFASFLNVCIYRIPRGESVVWPPSHCPNCKSRIRWYQNIPILSWLALRGRCANCHRPISVRYAVVELLGGILFLLAYLQWSMPFFFGGEPILGLVVYKSFWMLPVIWVLLMWLILMAFIDLENFCFPTNLLYAGMVMGPVLSILVPEVQGETERLVALAWSVGGGVCGFVVLEAFRRIANRVLAKKLAGREFQEAMGDGDPMLMAGIGSFFGPVAALMAIVLSSLFGSVIGLALLARNKAKLGGFLAVPYGPYLVLGTLVWIYWGTKIPNWYCRHLGF